MIFRVIFWSSNIKDMSSGHVIFTFQFEYHKLWNLCKISIFKFKFGYQAKQSGLNIQRKNQLGNRFEKKKKKKQFWRFEVVVIQNVATSNSQTILLLIYKWVWSHVWSPSTFLVFLVAFTLLVLLSFVLLLLFFFTLLLIFPSTLLFLLIFELLILFLFMLLFLFLFVLLLLLIFMLLLLLLVLKKKLSSSFSCFYSFLSHYCCC